MTTQYELACRAIKDRRDEVERLVLGGSTSPQIVEHFGINICTRYFGKAFKNIFGETPVEYRIRVNAERCAKEAGENGLLDEMRKKKSEDEVYNNGRPVKGFQGVSPKYRHSGVRKHTDF